MSTDESHRKRWKVRSRRPVYDNPWITLTEFDTLAPTGAPALYGLVHFKNVAVGVLPIDEEGRTIVVGQERFTFDAYSWELPEGGAAVGADPLEGARRELAEETGLKAANWLPLFTDAQLSNSVTDERASAWIAWGLLPDEGHFRDSSEELSVRCVPFAEAVAMAVSGEIADAFSLVMLFKADHLLRTGALPPDLLRILQGRA